MRLPCRKLDSSYTICKYQCDILAVIFNAAEHRVTLVTLITLITGCLSIVFPCLAVVVSDVPIAISYLEFRCKTVNTVLSHSDNLVIVTVKHPLAVDSPIPTAILSLLHADYRRMSFISLFAMINLYATTLRKSNFVAYLNATFHDRNDLVDIILLLQRRDDSLKRIYIFIQLIAKLIESRVNLVEFFMNVVNLLTKHVRTRNSSSE